MEGLIFNTETGVWTHNGNLCIVDIKTKKYYYLSNSLEKCIRKMYKRAGIPLEDFKKLHNDGI